MNFKAFLSSSKIQGKAGDIESSLLRRKSIGTFAGFIALISAATQISLILAEIESFDKIINFLGKVFLLRFDEITIKLNDYQVLGWLIVGIGVLLYLLLRRTGFLIKESEQAFQYTFWIQEFNEIKDTPGNRYTLDESDRFKLLHHDLTERLNQRIHRFSSLEIPAQESDTAVNSAWMRKAGTSHIHISGNFVIRELSDGKWVAQVTPTIRIGPEGRASTIAAPVRFPLIKNENKNPEFEKGNTYKQTGYKLDAAEYLHIVERVYSRLATEVYARIDQDVRDKVLLFPTTSLRSMALYYEAEDFANSNTVDAYQRAIQLYREAMRDFRFLEMKWLTQKVLKYPILLWRIDITWHHRWSKLVVGYAKCLMYRKEISTLAGRRTNSIYELAELLEPAIKNMEEVHQHVVRCADKSPLAFLQAFLHYPEDNWINRLKCVSGQRFFSQHNKIIFDLYVINAYRNTYYSNTVAAQTLLQDAKAISPALWENDPICLLVRGLLVTIPKKAIIFYRQALEADPSFQIARWHIAKSSEIDFRRRDDLRANQAAKIIENYEDVLNINNGNIAALSAQGHTYWLLDNNEKAKLKLGYGREIKAISSDTYIGELNYRLARIAAEDRQYDLCYMLYMEAKEMDPSIGSNTPGSATRYEFDDYQQIGINGLHRFKSFAEVVEQDISSSLSKGNEGISNRILNFVLCFVFNDYGNACLTYFYQNGDQSFLDMAIVAYGKATAVDFDEAVVWFNIQNAYGWNGQYDMAQDCFENARKLAPHWTDVAIKAYLENLKQIIITRDTAKSDLSNAIKKKNNIKKELDESKTQSSKKISTTRKVSNFTPEFDTDSIRQLKKGGIQKVHNFQKQDKQSSMIMSGEVGFLPRDIVNALIKIGINYKKNKISLKSQVKLEEHLSKEISRDLTSTERDRIQDIAWTKNPQLNSQLKNTNDELDIIQKIDNEYKEAERECEKLEKNYKKIKDAFETSRDNALKFISKQSRLGTLFLNLDEMSVLPFKSISKKQLDDNDVQILIALSEVLKLDANNIRYLSFSKQLAEYLFTLEPFNYHYISVLIDAIQALIEAKKCGYADLMADAKKQQKNVTKQWLIDYPDNFLGHYWYILVNGKEPKSLQGEIFHINNDKITVLQGHAHYTLNEYSAAIASYENAIMENPNEDSYYLSLDRALIKQHDLPLTLKVYEKIIKVVPNREQYKQTASKVFYELGDYFFQQENYRDAINSFNAAIEGSTTQIKRFPEYPTCYDKLSKSLQRVKDQPKLLTIPQALNAAKKAVELDSENDAYIQHHDVLERNNNSLATYGESRLVSMISVVTPIAVEFSQNLRDVLGDIDNTELSTRTIEDITKMRESIKSRYGVRIPGARLRVNVSDLPDDTYIIMINETPLVMGNITHDEALCESTVDELKNLEIPAKTATDPLTNHNAALINHVNWEQAEKEKLIVHKPLAYLLRHLKAVILANIGDMLGHQEVIYIVQQWQNRVTQDDTVKQLIADYATTTRLVVVLQSLISEKVPIAAIDEILEYYYFNYRNSIGEIVEGIRLLDKVRKSLPGNTENYTLIPLSNELEARIAKDIITQSNGEPLSILTMKPEDCQEVLALFRNVVTKEANPDLAFLVANPDLRIHVRKLVELEFPKVSVLSINEVLANLKIDYSKQILST